MIPADEMAAMAAVAEASLDTPISVQRRTTSEDRWGSESETWPTVASCKARFATPNTPALVALAERLQVEQLWKVAYSLSVDVRAGDRLQTADGQTYRVHTIESPQSYSTLSGALVSALK